MAALASTHGGMRAAAHPRGRKNHAWGHDAHVPRGFAGIAAPRAKRGEPEVDYGENWYEQTRNAATFRRGIRYKKNFAAKEIERKDLYSEKWAGDEYRGSRWNVLTVFALLFFLTPTVGLIFAYFTYGKYWG